MSHANEEEIKRLRALFRLCLDGYHSAIERVHQLQREKTAKTNNPERRERPLEERS